MTQITSVAFPDAEKFLKDMLPDMVVDGISAVYRTKLSKEVFDAVYFDEEENQSKRVSFYDHVQALKKMVELIDGKKLFLQGINSGMDLAEPTNWDVEVCDAYFQLCFHGEVIYG